LRPIPISFTDYDAYLQHWEPALIDEIKANVLSNAPQNTRPPPPSSSGGSGGAGSGRQFVASVSALTSATGGGADSPLVTLNCHFNDTPAPTATASASAAAAGGGGERGVRPERVGVGVMDLVLLLHPPLTHAATTAAGNSSSLPTHHRIPVFFNTSHLFSSRSSASVGQVALTPPRAETLLRQGWGAVLALVTSNTRYDGSRGLVVKAPRRHWAALEADAAASVSVAAIRPGGGGGGGGGAGRRQGTLSLPYLVLDNLTTAWREYLALHDVPTLVNRALVTDILAAFPREVRARVSFFLAAHSVFAACSLYAVI